MALQNITPYLYPDTIGGLAASGSTWLVSLGMDASTNRLAVSFQCPKSGDLDRVEFFIFAGSDTTNTLRVGWLLFLFPMICTPRKPLCLRG
jgi:hypothetical protein